MRHWTDRSDLFELQTAEIVLSAPERRLQLSEKQEPPVYWCSFVFINVVCPWFKTQLSVHGSKLQFDWRATAHSRGGKNPSWYQTLTSGFVKVALQLDEGGGERLSAVVLK